ncbi:hypothetical protein F4810DRAFT_722093 [Camillea tinctor]|nr:hypothetical protein F4810DRAFT_722093 [Camillea tinctor]
MNNVSSAVMHPPPPSVSVALTISPSTYKRGDGDSGNAVPDLSVAATLDSSAPKPVTIRTWASILDPALALQRREFNAQDISQDPPANISLEIIKGPNRLPFKRKKGSYDEKYYVTLHPGQEVTVAKTPLGIVKRLKNGTPIFQAGHTYSLGLSDEGKNIGPWWWGVTDDVLDEVAGPRKKVSGIKGKGEIVLEMEPVSFKVVE